MLLVMLWNGLILKKDKYTKTYRYQVTRFLPYLMVLTTLQPTNCYLISSPSGLYGSTNFF